MITLYRSLCAILASLALLSSIAQPAIGEWRDHLTYRTSISIAEGNGIAFVATESAVFSHDPNSGEIERLSTVNVLNDVGISTIAWSDTLNALLVGYTNGNLDIIRGARNSNLNDIKQSSLIGNKSINSIHFQDDRAYLGCGFGVVVIDLFEEEVVETWFIGPGGSQLNVADIVFFNDSIYCATPTGLYVASSNSPNLTAFTNWQKNQSIGSLPNGPFNAVEALAGKLYVNHNSPDPESDSLFYTSDQVSWTKYNQVAGERNLSVRTDNGLLIISHDFGVSVHDATPTDINLVYGYDADFANPNDAMRSTFGHIIIADKRFGLVRSPGGNTAERIFPNGPGTIDSYRMDSKGGALYVATGSVEGNWSNRFDKHGVFHFKDDFWGETTRDNEPLMFGVNAYGEAAVDIMGVTVDPDDPDHAWATSYEEGVIEFRNRQAINIYNQSNSGLQESDSTIVRAVGITYDDEGNLWMTNTEVDRPIVVRTEDGQWLNFDPGSILNNNRLMSDIIVGQNGYKWIIRPRNSGLLVFNDNGTLSNDADDEYAVLTAQEGEGGLPSLDVLSIAEDPDGEIWVGTNKGIGVFYDPDAVFNSSNFDAQQILIEQDGNVQILLETESVTAIAVDGAGRKWLGTSTSGVFLVSEDGTEQIHHFTTDNSPLPGNSITSIAIDELSGEVFIGTEFGILSYRSDATESVFPSSCAKVFPNPVNPDYTGPIAITGLTRDSDVRITDTAGNVVYTTTSLGGQAIWPGTNMDGERVSSGVYIAFAVDPFGLEDCSTKILFIR